MAKDKTPNAPSLPRAASGQILRAQKAIVTGANSGIGRGVAIALGAAGADVLVNFYSGEEAAQAVVQEIQRCGARAVAHQADVSKEEEVIAMFERAKREFGTTDILVNNAGIQQDAAFVDMTLEQWNRVISVNLTGQFLCAREAVKEFLRRGVVAEVSASAGKIICISSVHELIPWAGHVNYAASKGGVMLMMKSIAQEVAPNLSFAKSQSGSKSDAMKTPVARSTVPALELGSLLLRPGGTLSGRQTFSCRTVRPFLSLQCLNLPPQCRPFSFQRLTRAEEHSDEVEHVPNRPKDHCIPQAAASHL